MAPELTAFLLFVAIGFTCVIPILLSILRQRQWNEENRKEQEMVDYQAMKPPWTLYVEKGVAVAILPSGRPGKVMDTTGWPISTAEAVVRAANESTSDILNRVEQLRLAISGNNYKILSYRYVGLGATKVDQVWPGIDAVDAAKDFIEELAVDGDLDTGTEVRVEVEGHGTVRLMMVMNPVITVLADDAPKNVKPI